MSIDKRVGRKRAGKYGGGLGRLGGDRPEPARVVEVGPELAGAEDDGGNMGRFVTAGGCWKTAGEDVSGSKRT